MTTSRQQLFSTASVLFFLSGSTGLAYEVIWFKRFSYIWGSSTLAMASVVASFLLGLGLGAYLWGRRADRLNEPLRWYGKCEIAIGLLAALIPFVLPLLSSFSSSLYTSLSAQPALHFLVQFALTFVTIGPACVLMGGTLPLLVREFTARDGKLTESTGWLYAINTFGAAAGCYLTGFHLLPTFGLFWTNNLAALLNLAIGAAALLASRDIAPAVPTSEPAEGSVSRSGITTATPWRTRGVYAAALFTGSAALVLQMTWARQMSLVLGGSTYAFSSTVFVVLAAIACGSLIYHQWLRTREDIALRAYVGVILLMALTTAVGMQLLPSLCQWAGTLREWRGTQFINALLCVGASSVVAFLPAVGMGILFPLLVQLTRRSASEAGKTVGNVYFWNTLGSILGATLTNALLIPRFGSYGTAALALCMYFAALLVVVRLPRRQSGLAWIGGAAVAALALYTALFEHDPRATNMGFFLYGDTAKKELDTSEILHFKEGPTANVLVLETKNHRSLRVNGKVDASNTLDMQMQVGCALIPRILQPRAKDVLVIGFGSGTTPGVSLLFPDTRVTCVEIERAVYEASELFGDVNHRPHESDRFEIVIGDARTFVQGTDRTFDLIISEPSNPWMAGVSALFTRNFFQAAKRRLNKGGILAQWMQTYQFTIEEYALVVRTLRSVFPYCGVVVLTRGADTVLLASDTPLLPTADDLALLQAQVDAIPALKNDLEKHFGTTDLSRLLLAHYLLGSFELNQLVAQVQGRTLNTDLNMRLEFDAPLWLFKKNSESTVMANTSIIEGIQPAWLERLAREIGRDLKDIDYLVEAGKFVESQSPQFSAQLFYETAIARAPDASKPRLQLAVSQFRHKEVDKATQTLVALLRRDPENIDAIHLLGQIFEFKRNYADATKLYRRVIELKPDSDDIGNNLAWILATCGDEKVRNGAEAVRLAQQICERDGYKRFEFVDTLAAAHAESGNFEEAIRLARIAQDAALAANNQQMSEQIGSRLRIYEAGQPYHEG